MMNTQLGTETFPASALHSMRRASSSSAPGVEPEDTDDSLEDVARQEQEFLRQRLREELKREPSEQELDEYERQHTEGY